MSENEMDLAEGIKNNFRKIEDLMIEWGAVENDHDQLEQKIENLEKKNEQHMNWHIDWAEKWKKRLEKLEKKKTDKDLYHEDPDWQTRYEDCIKSKISVSKVPKHWIKDALKEIKDDDDTTELQTDPEWEKTRLEYFKKDGEKDDPGMGFVYCPKCKHKWYLYGSDLK